MHGGVDRIGPGLVPHRLKHGPVDAIIGQIAFRRLLPRDQGTHEVGTLDETEHAPPVGHEYLANLVVLHEAGDVRSALRRARRDDTLRHYLPGVDTMAAGVALRPGARTI